MRVTRGGIGPSLTTSGGPLPRLREWLHAPHNGLTLSVHAGSEAVRARLVPKAPAARCALRCAARRASAMTRRRRRKTALAYLLIGGENDTRLRDRRVRRARSARSVSRSTCTRTMRCRRARSPAYRASATRQIYARMVAAGLRRADELAGAHREQRRLRHVGRAARCIAQCARRAKPAGSGRSSTARTGRLAAGRRAAARLLVNAIARGCAIREQTESAQRGTQVAFASVGSWSEFRGFAVVRRLQPDGAGRSGLHGRPRREPGSARCSKATSSTCASRPRCSPDRR